MQPEEHHDITQYGRNSLTGGAAASRMAQPWNRPSVARRGNGLGAEIESGQSRSSSSSAGAAEERREVVVGDDGGDGDNGVSAGAGAGAGGVVGGSASTHSTQSHSAMPPEQAAQTMGTQQADGSQPRGEGVVNVSLIDP